MRLPWAVLLLAVLAGRYLYWRFSSTLVLDGPLSAAVSLAMLVAELWLLAHSFLQLLFSLAPDPGIGSLARQAATRLEGRLRQQPEALPGVDVLVPTCGEPAALVERCLRGCLALDYPRMTVWLLDDAARPELARLCRDLGCRYLSRGSREHAKAGNLNHALPHLQGALIAVFDADVVPLRPFLGRTVGLFDDGAVGLVQTPQTYMNADPVMRNLRLERWLMPDEESFYRWVEPVRQGVGAVVCAGTSFVVRRAALAAVGGFETGTSSEDLATGIRITAAGWRCLFVPEKLSAGLAPFTATAMARQRCRWASGTLQTLRTGANPLTIPGLTPLQRLAFLEGILHWFNALPQLLLSLVPLSIGVLGVLPLQFTAAGLVQQALPFYAAQLLLARWFSGQARTAILPELYRWIFLLPLVGALLRSALNRPDPFQVTPKALSIGRQLGPDPRLLWPLLTLLALQLVALFHLVWPQRFAALGALPPLSSATLTLGITWGLLNGLLLLLAIRTCWDRRRCTEVPWFLPIDATGWLAEQPVRLRAISEEGVELEWVRPGTLDPGAAAWLHITVTAGLEPMPLPAAAVPPPCRRSAWPLRVEVRRGWRLGCRWAALSPRQRDDLQELLYRSPGIWPERRAPPEPLALLVVAGRLLGPVPPDTWFRRSLLPIRLGGLPQRRDPAIQDLAA